MHKTLHLPSSARGFAQARQQESAVAEENRQLAEEMHRVSAALEHYNRELYKIDPHLKVVLAKPHTTVDGLIPNFYHLVRMRPGHAAWIKPIAGPNGEWRDLDSSIFDLVAEADLWNDRTQREMRQKARRAEQARQRDRDRRAAERAREFDERWKAANRTSILVSRSI